jgi:hypothetical protein
MAEIKPDYLKDGLALIGGTTVLIILIYLGFKLIFSGFNSESKNEYIIRQTVASPDKKHIASLVFHSGGGAAGWCSAEVAITPTSKPFLSIKKEDRFRYKVFSMDCNPSTKIKWNSASAISISITDDLAGYRISDIDEYH